MTLDEQTIDDVALIFEGGGMRATYTSGVVRVLLENQLYFADAYGISAGSSHVVNYVSRDAQRAYVSFVDFFADPQTVGVKQFLLGNGYFNSQYIYQVSGLPDGALPLDFTKFMNSKTQMHIDGYEVDTDRTAHWTKDDIHVLQDLMLRVQASSSMPIFMPETRFDGHIYLDGGLGDSWGIMLDRAIADGYKRFFVVCTQEQGYRKQPDANKLLNRLALRRYPNVIRKIEERWEHYNRICDRLDQLQADGSALVFRPEQMNIKSSTKDIALLRQAAEQGYIQAGNELPDWLRFLG